MNKTIPPRTFPDIPIEAAEILALFRGAREVLLGGRRIYICHALSYTADRLGYKDPRNTGAHEIIEHRLGFMPTELGDELSARHTYTSWWRVQNNGATPIDDQALRILWLDDLIKEFSE